MRRGARVCARCGVRSGPLDAAVTPKVTTDEGAVRTAQVLARARPSSWGRLGRSSRVWSGRRTSFYTLSKYIQRAQRSRSSLTESTLKNDAVVPRSHMLFVKQ